MDININVVDVIGLVNIILSIDNNQNDYADLNGDGIINIIDVLQLVQFIFNI